MLRQSAMSLAKLASPTCTQCLRPIRPIAPVSLLSLRTASTHHNGNYNVNLDKPKRQPKPHHKPPKRRLEAASRPLRNAPSSTRGPVLQCIAHTTAERYDLVNLGVTLQNLGVRWDEVPEGDRERAIVIGPWKGRGGAERLIRGIDVRRVNNGEEEEDDANMGFGYGDRGEIWVFNSGSFVTWGLTEEEGRAFLREVIRRKHARIEYESFGVAEHEVEEMDFVVDPDAQTAILGNLIQLGSPPELNSFPHSPSLASVLARYTLSLALTRSSSLSVLEDRLDQHIASVSTLPRALEKTGAQPMGRREVIRKLGELMTLRMAVNTKGGGLEDTPEIYWSEPELESYFDSITTEFEMKERIETFNKKIDYAQEIQSNLRALLTEASAHRMEVIIILLIAVEVVIVLIREGPELGHKLISPLIHRVRVLLGAEAPDADDDLRSLTEQIARLHPAQSEETSGLGLLPSSRISTSKPDSDVRLV
ncbi:putative cytoplasm protein [Papiliotrema laurentii]|uniref:Cytoplasm protein n=1 Tax=Papiliotrema laurentii TaxID=5418 RepID=A0AAD9CY09_PAPLA|nr:putative cytoplasm protein [Papiliotrema laurentii]